MKSRYFKRCSFLGAVLVALLLFSSPVQGQHTTSNYYWITSGASPGFWAQDTDGGGLVFWALVNDYNSDGNLTLMQADTFQFPFSIEPSADTNLLYLDGTNRIGINTNVPAEDLDIRSTNPAIRLYDTTSGAGQVDLDMNSHEFAIQGETSQEIVEIDTRAPYPSFSIDSAGLVGLGIHSPTKKLHVYGNDPAIVGLNSITARVENVSGTKASRRMLELVNYGDPLLWFHNTWNDVRWAMNPIGDGFVFNKGGSGLTEMRINSTGDLIIAGSLTQNSDRNMKEQIHAVDPNEVLRKVAELPISRWQYKHDEQKNRHMGPMAQDFYASFGLGLNDKGLSPGDLSGVALAAIKGLNAAVKDKDVKIVQLEGKVADLEKKLQAQQDQLARLSALEPVVARLVHQLGAQGTMKVSFETAPVGNDAF